MSSSDKELVILEAASKVFMEHGFSASTTDMIQREAGVSKATLYARFASKEALFFAVIERQCGRLERALLEIEPVSGDLRSTLSALGRAYLDIVLSVAGLALFRVVVAEAPRFPQLARHFFVRGPQLMNRAVAKLLTLAAAHGEIDLQGVGVDAAAGLFVGMLRGEAQMECVTHPASRVSEVQCDAWVQLAVNAFLKAHATG